MTRASEGENSDPDFLTDAHGEPLGEPSEIIDELPPQEYHDWQIEYSPKSLARSPWKLFKAMGQDLWAGKELGWRLFVRNIVGSVRQTLLSYFWIILPTLATVAGWSFLHNQTLTSFYTGPSYLIFITVGSIFWQTFFDAILAPINAIKTNQRLIAKLNFPREALIIVGIGEVLFHLAVRLIVLAVFMLFTGTPVSVHSAMAIFWLFGLVCLGTSIGLFLAPIEVLYQDVGKSLAVLSPFWMILTPVVYMTPPSPGYQLWQSLNPPAAMLTTARDLLAMGEAAWQPAALVWWLIAIPLLLWSMIWYRLAFPIIIERMAS